MLGRAGVEVPAACNSANGTSSRARRALLQVMYNEEFMAIESGLTNSILQNLDRMRLDLLAALECCLGMLEVIAAQDNVTRLSSIYTQERGGSLASLAITDQRVLDLTEMD